jgi:putative peptidoglycan lipid II flippase
MTVVSFAQRLYQFPLGVFGIAVATAIFPLLAQQADTPADFRATLRRGLRLVVFIGLPASVGLMLVRTPLARVVLEGGAFDTADATRVGAVLLGYATAVWAYSMIHVLTRAFYAMGDAKRPVRIAVVMVGLNLVLNCTLIWPLGEAGLAWSTAICAGVQAVTLTIAMRRHSMRPVDRSVVSSWARTIVVTTVMGVVVWVVSGLMPETDSWFATLLVLLTPVGAGMLIVALAAATLRMPELRWSLGR